MSMRTTVIGAGQAGLAVAHHLDRLGQSVRIVAADQRVGDTWRQRWDSLRLFTPAFYNGLPGMPFPADHPEYLPVKDEVADYLESYAGALDVPIELGTRVEAVEPCVGGSPGERFELSTDDGPVRCRDVVLATGAYRTPWIPPFAGALDPDIRQLHSSGYRNPGALPPGDLLVVGAGNSGTQIAAELGRARPDDTVWLSGRDTGRLPRRLLGRDIYRWIVPTLFRVRSTSFLGRRLRARMTAGGDPVFRPEHEAMVEAGVRRVGRTVGVDERGRPVVENGEAQEGAAGRGAATLDPAAVVWCTGFRNDFGWVRVPGAMEAGQPLHDRGVSPVPGLHFLGLRFLHRPGSSLIGGVGEDARHVAETIARGR